MKRFLVIPAFILVFGCSHGEHTRQKEFDQQTRKIEGLEKQISELRAQLKLLKEQLIERVRRSPGIKVISREVHRRPSIIPDGEVIRADIDHGFAYIDLGWKHGIRPGSRFHVYEVLKGGRLKNKGDLRIIRVERDFSQCSILAQEDVANPIVKGDYIWNKFFERNIKIFVFVGDFDSENARYSKDQLKKMIEENGHVVSKTVRSDTDYAILGEDYTQDPKYKTVQDFKIEKISPRILLEYFGEVSNPEDDERSEKPEKPKSTKEGEKTKEK